MVIKILIPLRLEPHESSPGGTITYCACKSASRLAFSAAAEALAFKGPDPSARPFGFPLPVTRNLYPGLTYSSESTKQYNSSFVLYSPQSQIPNEPTPSRFHGVLSKVK